VLLLGVFQGGEDPPGEREDLILALDEGSPRFSLWPSSGASPSSKNDI
jgi:hypothetical protein